MLSDLFFIFSTRQPLQSWYFYTANTIENPDQALVNFSKQMYLHQHHQWLLRLILEQILADWSSVCKSQSLKVDRNVMRVLNKDKSLKTLLAKEVVVTLSDDQKCRFKKKCETS